MAENYTRVYWLHALTGIHVGAGTGAGFVDLPILREQITQWPYIPGTSVKGVMAAAYDAADDRNRTGAKLAAFGKADGEDGGTNSGSLVYTDARLVCLPVSSFFGTFAWTTSWLALRRLSRDLASAGIQAPEITEGSDAVGAGGPAIVATQSSLTSSGRVHLGDIDLPSSEGAERWATFLAEQVFDAEWQKEFIKRFVILPEDTFNHFCRYGCEVVPRIRIDAERKTVMRGALWLEECLPAESILAGLTWCDQVYAPNVSLTREQLLTEYCKDKPWMQFGGKGTVGRGRASVRFRKGS